ncbi:MAG TPA: hypothetical protein VJ731_11815 [Terriglobales bacterium]|nr:hypothetical protein [Terriglobales bacterium]
MDVTPILRDPLGREHKLTSLQLSPDEIQKIDLSAAAADIAGHTDSYGSLLLRFNSGNFSNIYAAVLVQRLGHPISFHFDAYPVFPEFASGSRESIWWLPHQTSDGYFVISNFADRAVGGRLLITQDGRASATHLALAPRQTQRMSIRELVQSAGFQGSQGGIKFETKADAASIYVAQVLFDETAGFSAVMKVFPKDVNAPPDAFTLRAPLVGLATPDPMLAYPAGTVLHPNILLRNATSAPLATILNLRWKGSASTGTFQVKLAPLAPEEVRVLDLLRLKKDAVPTDANWANVEITYSGRPGDLIAIANSYDDSTRYGIQSPFTDSLSFMWKGGMWHVDAQHNTMITTGNAGDKNAVVQVRLLYGQKSAYELPDRTLRPGEQMWIEVGSLIRNQVPDKNGHVLPLDTMEGSYEIRNLTDHQIGYLYEGKVITDKTFGHATYGCAICCNNGGPGYSGFFLLPNPLSGGPGGAGQFDAWATNLCTAQNEPVSALSWSSSLTSVATINGTGYARFVSPGTSTITALAKLQSVQNPSCRPQTYQAQAPTNVVPTVNLQGNNYIYIGHDPQVTQHINGFYASGTPSGGTYSWSTTDSSVSFDNNASATVHVTATKYSGGTNDTPITVNYSYNSKAASPRTINVTKREFYYLAGDSKLLYSNYSGPSMYGYLYYVYYKVFTHPDHNQVTDGEGVGASENLTQTFCSPCNISLSTGSATLTSNNQVQDMLKLTNSTPLPPDLQITDNQDLFVGGLYVRSNGLTFTANDVTISSDGPSN